MTLGFLLSVGAIVFWAGVQYGQISDLKKRVSVLENVISQINPRLDQIQAQLVFETHEIHKINLRMQALARRQRRHWKNTGG